jgi:hypothetical protein
MTGSAEAIHRAATEEWIALSQVLLAMTAVDAGARRHLAMRSAFGLIDFQAVPMG